VRALPNTFIIDRKGVIRSVIFGGPISAAVLQTKVGALLDEAAVGLYSIAVLFAVGAVLLFRSARQPSQPDDPTDAAVPNASIWAAAGGSFALILLAEWGDLTQLATASLAARSGDAFWTGLGALGALASVAAIAATFGRRLVARVAMEKINYVGAFIFAALATWTVVELVA